MAKATVGVSTHDHQVSLVFLELLKGDILDIPTRGIDIGAKIAIYRLIAGLADGGVAILLISSELEEVVGLAHRVMVMRRGRMARMLDLDEIDDETILAECLGVAD